MLRRTGFGRKPYPRTPPAPPSRGRMASMGPVELAPAPKREYVRSPALLKACREIPCQSCGRQDGSIVAAHSNQGRHGKGRSIKASDQFVAALCGYCHHEVDQGKSSGAEREAIWTKAHHKTVRALLSAGLWPADVPVPDIRSFQ